MYFLNQILLITDFPSYRKVIYCIKGYVIRVAFLKIEILLIQPFIFICLVALVASTLLRNCWLESEICIVHV